MKLMYPIIILFLLSAQAWAQLAPDRERFDIELHPGEVEVKELTLTNTGDTPITQVTATPVGGSAKDFVFLDMSGIKTLGPGENEKVSVFFAIPPEAKPGGYTGYIYLFDDTPPSVPAVVSFNLEVVKQESYGLSLTINDAKSASAFAKPDDAGEFDLEVKNQGQFRDVISIDTSQLPEGWSANLMEGEKEIDLPYHLPLAPGVSHPMKLQVNSENPGDEGKFKITATSLGNKTQNDTVDASVEFGMAVRGYNVKVDVPEVVAANRTYTGTVSVALEIGENIAVGVITPPELMVIPIIQSVTVTPEAPGLANLTMMALKPGRYPMIIKLVDSHGVPMPDEMATVDAVEPNGTAVLTSDDLKYSTVVSLCDPDNTSVPFLATSGKLSEKDKEDLYGYSNVIILGNASVVPEEYEKEIADTVNTTRIGGKSLQEVSWKFTSMMWTNGTSGVILTGPKETDIFRGYREARIRNLPLVVSDSSLTGETLAVIKEMIGRKVKLSKVVVVGKVRDDVVKALEAEGLSIERVAA